MNKTAEKVPSRILGLWLNGMYDNAIDILVSYDFMWDQTMTETSKNFTVLVISDLFDKEPKAVAKAIKYAQKEKERKEKKKSINIAWKKPRKIKLYTNYPKSECPDELNNLSIGNNVKLKTIKGESIWVEVSRIAYPGRYFGSVPNGNVYIFEASNIFDWSEK